MNLRPTEKAALRQLKAFIDEHFQKSVSISDISQRSWLVETKVPSYNGEKTITETVTFSRMRLQQAFKEVFLFTIHEYETNLKLELAKSLLKNTGKPIKEIAIEVGYSRSEKFIPVFKKHFTLTPKAYRELCSATAEKMH